MENLVRYSPTPVVWTLAIGLIIFQLLVIQRLPPLQSKKPLLSVAKKIHLKIKPVLKKVQPPVKKPYISKKMAKQPKAITQPKIKPIPPTKKNIVKVISPQKLQMSQVQKVSSIVKVVQPKALVEIKHNMVVKPINSPKPLTRKKIVKLTSPPKPKMSPEPKLSSVVNVIKPTSLINKNTFKVISSKKRRLLSDLKIPSPVKAKSLSQAQPREVMPLPQQQHNTPSDPPKKNIVEASTSKVKLLSSAKKSEKEIQKPKTLNPATPLVQKQEVAHVSNTPSQQIVKLKREPKNSSSQTDKHEKPEDLQRLGSIINQYIAGIDLFDYYPRRALKRKLKGKVLITLNFDSKANLKGIQLKTTSGYKVLDQAAFRIMKEHGESMMASIQQQQFELPIQTRISVPIRFALR